MRGVVRAEGKLLRPWTSNGTGCEREQSSFSGVANDDEQIRGRTESYRAELSGVIIASITVLLAGTKLGPYEIQSQLGAGGMGEVYRARDARLSRTVAIKILRSNFSTDAAHKQRFDREAKIISNLNHPHICVLYDIGSQDGLDYLVNSPNALTQLLVCPPTGQGKHGSSSLASQANEAAIFRVR